MIKTKIIKSSGPVYALMYNRTKICIASLLDGFNNHLAVWWNEDPLSFSYRQSLKCHRICNITKHNSWCFQERSTMVTTTCTHRTKSPNLDTAASTLIFAWLLGGGTQCLGLRYLDAKLPLLACVTFQSTTSLLVALFLKGPAHLMYKGNTMWLLWFWEHSRSFLCPFFLSYFFSFSFLFSSSF